MKRLLMACVLGMALAFCMSGCKSSDWNPFSTDNPKTTCSCCGKANCKCPKDANGVCKCQCCKNGADKCKCCNQYDLWSCKEITEPFHVSFSGRIA